MYMIHASVAPEHVCFTTPDLSVPELRELTAWEIGVVSGGCRLCNDIRQISTGVVAFGSGVALGGFFNPGFFLAGGALAFVGSAGLFAADRLQIFANAEGLDI